MHWLDALPHQIPFRAASAVRSRSGKSLEGAFLVTANDFLPPEVMVVEAMAQFAGGLAFDEQHGHGYLSGVDRCEVTRALESGELVLITVTLEAGFGKIFRFSGIGQVDGVEVARARFYLASPDEDA